MIKLGCGAVTLLSLLAAGLMLWVTPGFGDILAAGPVGWALIWISLFHDPAAAAALFVLTAALAATAASVSEILLGLIFSVITAVFALLCLLGMASVRNPDIAEAVQNFFR